MDRSATLEWSESHGPYRLFGPDGLGGTWAFENLHPGPYRLGIVYMPVAEPRTADLGIGDVPLCADPVDVVIR